MDADVGSVADLDGSESVFQLARIRFHSDADQDPVSFDYLKIKKCIGTYTGTYILYKSQIFLYYAYIYNFQF